MIKVYLTKQLYQTSKTIVGLRRPYLMPYLDGIPKKRKEDPTGRFTGIPSEMLIKLWFQ